MKLLRECIIVGGQISGGNVLGKTRDRNYVPKLRLVRELMNGVEVVYLHDLYTNYMEGMNEKGIGVINAALLVGEDEKAVCPYCSRVFMLKLNYPDSVDNGLEN